MFAIAFYLSFVFYVPDLLKHRKPFSLKWPFAAWNVFLALSLAGRSARSRTWSAS